MTNDRLAKTRKKVVHMKKVKNHKKINLCILTYDAKNRVVTFSDSRWPLRQRSQINVSQRSNLIKILLINKRYFIIDQKIARHFVQYNESLSTFPFLLCNSNNKPFRSIQGSQLITIKNRDFSQSFLDKQGMYLRKS